jgi:predicted DNA-binding protein (MmcQ/YjbR family)
MTFKALRDYCRSKPGAVEEFPFGEETLVFKVMGKIFALTGVERLPLAVNLKCDPDLAVELRDRWPAVQPGYHMNKTHWNTVELDGSIPADKVREMIDHSYGLVVAGLKKAERQRLEELTRAG